MTKVITINRTQVRELVLRWNSREYITHTRMLSLRQRGALLQRIDSAALRGELSELRNYSWIEGAFWRRVGGRPRVSTAVRREVLSAGECAACGAIEQLTVDHIQPLAKGGSNTRENLQCLCWPCNHKKRDHWSPVHG